MCLSQFIQTYIWPNIGSILMFLVTLALAILTFLYLRTTRKMANVVEKEFEVRTKPVVDITLIWTSSALSWIKLHHTIENKGTYAIFLKQYLVNLTHTDLPEQSFHSCKIDVEKHIKANDNITREEKHRFDALDKSPIKKAKNIIDIDVKYIFSDIFDKEFIKTAKISTDLGAS